MSEIMGVNLNLNQEYIKSSVEEIVKAGIIQALGDPSVIVKSAIDCVINKKVDRDGKESNGYNAKPYLNWLAEKTVEQAVREAINDYVKEHSDDFKSEVARLLNTKKFRQASAEAFIQCILDAGKSTWKMPLSISFEAPKDY